MKKENQGISKESGTTLGDKRMKKLTSEFSKSTSG